MKRILIGICTCILALSVCACSNQSAEQDKNNKNETSTSTKAEVFGPVQTYDVYEHGEHHIQMTLAGFDETIELTVYSNAAPKTASLFCHLARSGYYKGLSINTIMKDLYISFGDSSGKTRGEHLALGEYADAGTSNSLSLTRGVLAMSRTDDGKSSDASKIFIIMSDASYLDGNYAAFAKVTKGIDLLDDISSISFASTEKQELAEYKLKLKAARKAAKKAESSNASQSNNAGQSSNTAESGNASKSGNASQSTNEAESSSASKSGNAGQSTKEAKNSKTSKDSSTKKGESNLNTPIELKDPILVKADGTIKKKKMCPVIKSMKVVD